MALNALAVGGGVTGPRDARHAVGGLLAVQGPSALDVRTGVLLAPGSTQLITGTTKTGPKMSVRLAPHVAVTSRGQANGPYLGPTLEAPLDVDVDLAPASGSRIDVVWVRQRDTTSGVPTPDVSPGPEYGVLRGQASTGTPVKPNLADVVGAEELGTVTVAAGATSTLGAGVTIANTARQTVARGADIPVRSQAERDALSPFWPLLTVRRLDTGAIEMRNVDNTAWVTVYAPGAGWVTEVATANTYDWGFPGVWTTLAQMSVNVTVPAGRELEVEWKAPRLICPPGGELSLRLLIGGAQQDIANVSVGSTSIYLPGRLTGSIKGDGSSVNIAVQGIASSGTVAYVRGASLGPVLLRRRIS